ncbi:MAG TPA: IS200/IS605 family transposase [Saprospirales bacterium]|nr:IS200/IS605 family transposase [Saprospirales bacterium]HRQ28509.1 IS200/IS605 family transposase [Saprospiraceae bacterium]
MSATFSQIYIQYVFAVKGRRNLLQKPWRDEVFKYISGIIKGKNQKPIIVNGVSDHVHVFVGLKPSISISELVRDIKNNSSNFINDQKWIEDKFSWQEGFGAFSYSHSQIENVYKYIAKQEIHHRKIPFKDEYIELLRKMAIEFNEKYLFDWV